MKKRRISFARYLLRGTLAAFLVAGIAMAQGTPQGNSDGGQSGSRNAMRPKFPLTSVRLPKISSDSMGVDFAPYFHASVLPAVRRSWHAAIRQKGIAPPTGRKIVAEFTILKDGAIDGLKLVEGSDDPETDQAALDAITNSAPFDALPAEFKGQSLTLRCRLDVFFPFYANGITPPSVINPRAGAEYSEKARRKHVEGVVVLTLVVSPDGKPTDIQVTRSVGSGLDEKAIEAVKQWRFHPAMKDGNPVEASIAVEVDFHLYK